MQPPRIRCRERGAAGDRVGIAVDREQRAAGRAQDRRRMAAAAERAVEIDAAIGGRERRQHLRGHHRDVGHGAARPRQGRCAGPRQGHAARTQPLARLGAAALGGVGTPDLEDAAEAHELDLLGEAGVRHQRFGQHDAALAVGLDREGVGIEGDGEAVMRVAEQVEPVERGCQRLEHRRRPGLDAGMLVARPQHHRTVGGQRAQRRAERGRDRHPALRVQPVQVGAEELAHSARLAPSCAATARHRTAGTPGPRRAGPNRPAAATPLPRCETPPPPGMAWDNMG